ncbi:bifunctional UDP-N-acetylglucosamine diphosphorylase/glucosamine-1-phosphate N-acetyltransferase GlmU [Nevskia sp.]|uniref:bifunctional UDP-N-acetylglucosamine diphosphorylase/glucosamine-1-phosphate N-acetyltransferase GlmU n=1 Tax=Nevskia sp. TaxID=1929292 RepID=UPI0025D286A5|nr:bifunctional UDP-N-acetylglucosamine diphosphorylase/glucosamine-1-phosphate N-acetyltransferase GlmU [Nevskia sp.]
MTDRVHAIVLAAGQGTRMKSARPKVLHAIGGKPMLGHVLDAVSAAGVGSAHLVLGHGADQVRDWLASRAVEAPRSVIQQQQLGTAHAVSQAMPDVPDTALVLVLYGDVPLISAATLEALIAAAADGFGLLTVTLDEPRGYGRILRDEKGRVTGIVEEKDATPAQRAIREVNTGLIAAPARRLRRWLAHVGNDNANREFYLTDVVGLAARDGVAIRTINAATREEVEGVNDPLQLARAERVYQRRHVERLQREGLYLADPARFDLRGTLSIGRDVRIDIGCIVEGTVSLGDDVQIGPYCILRDVTIAAGTRVDAYSLLDDSEVGSACIVGPYARLRPGTVLGSGVHIGNFVELKKTTVGDGSKANHLAYLGDAVIGARVNIGAGVITCNYDGANKFTTFIGDDAFIGTDSQLVAPVNIGRGAYIAAGSTIAKDAPDDQLTINRARDQRSLPWWVRPKKKP